MELRLWTSLGPSHPPPLEQWRAAGQLRLAAIVTGNDPSYRLVVANNGPRQFEFCVPAMNVRRIQSAKMARQARGRNRSVRSHAGQGRPKQARRSSTGQRNAREPFAPPEDWYEPTDADTYRIVV